MNERLRPLTMNALLAAQSEAASLAAYCGEDAALCACVLARAVRGQGGRRRWRSGRAVLKKLSAEQLVELTERYLACCREASDVDAAMERLARSPAERLRWTLLGILTRRPVHAGRATLSPEAVRDCVANLLLDAGGEAAYNPAYDERAFREGRRGA